MKSLKLSRMRLRDLRIFKAIEKEIMKYSENKNYKVIAVVMACFSAEEQRMLIKRIMARCEEYQCKVIFFSTISDFQIGEDESIPEESIFDIISVESFDAILLMEETFKTETATKRLIKRAIAAEVPVIAVDHHMDGCINISFDYTEAFRKVVKHMIEYHGYRTINFFGGIPNNSFSDVRLNVFKEVLEENNIPFDPKRVYYGYFWENPTVIAVEQMLKDWKGLPDAIICANDTMALTACDCLQKKGYRIPQDVAVSGFDGIEAEKFHFPRLLTSLYDRDVFLDAVFRLVQDENLVAEEREVYVSAYENMQIGGSCGCKGLSEQNAAAEIIRLKSNMNELMVYQTDLGQMVAKYGNTEEKEIFEKVIPHEIRRMNYYDFWCCMTSSIDTIDTIHYKRNGDSEEVHRVDGVPSRELIPNLNEQLEIGKPLMVVATPSQNDPMGYAVVGFDTEKFWYSAYSSFIAYLCYMFDMIRTQKEMVRLYRSDSLTGLLNRNGFYAKMGQVLSLPTTKELTIISLDLCLFKQINDNYGHAEGDYALEQVGSIIRDSVVENEISARNGGDEFLIVLYQDDQKERTGEIIASLEEKANQFNQRNPKDYKIIFSIGVCTEATENHTLDYFLREADRRMYEHKKTQKRKEGES